MCNEFKSKKDFSFSFLSLSIGFFRFALSFSNRNLTEIYTELELKNSATYSLERPCANSFDSDASGRFSVLVALQIFIPCISSIPLAQPIKTQDSLHAACSRKQKHDRRSSVVASLHPKSCDDRKCFCVRMLWKTP